MMGFDRDADGLVSKADGEEALLTGVLIQFSPSVSICLFQIAHCDSEQFRDS